MAQIEKIEKDISDLKIKWSDGEESKFNYMWLRDNCPTAHDKDSRHRMFNILNVSKDLSVKDFRIMSVIEEKCKQKGVRLTEQRRVIAKVMSESKLTFGSKDHPDVDELHKRVSQIDKKISIATVYRTVKLFEESGILTKHEFKGGKARYEELNEGHHDHLIDVKTGEIIEFVDEEIEKLQKKVAQKFGYELVDHKLELYGIKKNK